VRIIPHAVSGLETIVGSELVHSDVRPAAAINQLPSSITSSPVKMAFGYMLMRGSDASNTHLMVPVK
jgi:hypothetical protein